MELNQEVDFIVVGSGVAGLLCSLFAADYGRVALFSKSEVQASNSMLAQGGIAAAIGTNDDPLMHEEDTLRTGQGLCDREVVRSLIREGPQMIQFLQQLGVSFDQNAESGLALGMEGAHQRARILHIGGDQTGKGITEVLLEQVLSHSQITVYAKTSVHELAVEDGQCVGVWVVDEQNELLYYRAKAVVLATGGLGQIYQYTTNHPIATGDGYVLAYHAGATLRDMEFVQFHPTGLRVDSDSSSLTVPLISEAVRGEGATLVNEHKTPFMHRYHEWKDLASRDIVSRAIFTEMENGHEIFLDARKIKNFSSRFPSISKQCEKIGISPAQDLIPIVPVAHYSMGGIATDAYGQTSLQRLFAIGEVASSGFHGANRLASNSLLEGLVMARRAVERMAKLPPLSSERSIELSRPSLCASDLEINPELFKLIRQLMWKNVGIVREASRLYEAIQILQQQMKKFGDSLNVNRSLLEIALLVTRAALWRQESRGAHFRSDFPNVSSEFQRHSVQTSEHRLSSALL
ncbi:L-aspartate oxidase [Sulfoacidibacillus thermotolerans]|uniref:L-aspartate oxidase n=1 Tax=Sulfoacidibacillus thermotolerans TaxID=1765684 RepID=A0A2U3D6W6_SULT2|nr:L-aspartate oxidase [Sulfoacidibacillus thermotolerans]PWI57030.1 L-aspartate oxidase [Sulfoacidibacillus thermotolerans]